MCCYSKHSHMFFPGTRICRALAAVPTPRGLSRCDMWQICWFIKIHLEESGSVETTVFPYYWVEIVILRSFRICHLWVRWRDLEILRMESLPPHVACFGEARSPFETQLPTIAPVLSMSTMATCMAADSEEDFWHGFGKCWRFLSSLFCVVDGSAGTGTR